MKGQYTDEVSRIHEKLNILIDAFIELDKKIDNLTIVTPNKRKKGDIDFCSVCGVEYNLRSSKSVRCEDCQKDKDRQYWLNRRK